MTTPLFSIIIPTYNRRRMLQRAVESVLIQEYDNWELIIVNDGSTDDTEKYIQDLKNSKIKYFYQENKGRSYSRNIGIGESVGAYICFLDNDDELLPEYLSEFEKTILHQPNNTILAGVRLMDNGYTSEILPALNKKECIIQCLEGYFNLMPFCFPKTIIKSNRFNNELYYGEDFHFFIPILVNNDFTTIDFVTSKVHQHSNRTINKIFDNISEGYIQLQKSVIQTLDNNYKQLLLFMDKKEIQNIKTTKVKDYILTAAKYNYTMASRINNSQDIAYIHKTQLLLQRLKGLIQ